LHAILDQQAHHLVLGHVRAEGCEVDGLQEPFEDQTDFWRLSLAFVVFVASVQSQDGDAAQARIDRHGACKHGQNIVPFVGAKGTLHSLLHELEYLCVDSEKDVVMVVPLWALGRGGGPAESGRGRRDLLRLRDFEPSFNVFARLLHASDVSLEMFDSPIHDETQVLQGRQLGTLVLKHFPQLFIDCGGAGVRSLGRFLVDHRKQLLV